MVASRVHGRELVARWNGEGLPPVHSVPPFPGLPALEQTHPFHFKMTPGVMLGPRCNHDLGVILRPPVPQHIALTADASKGISLAAGLDIRQADLTCGQTLSAEHSTEGQFHMESPMGADGGDACSNSLLRPRGFYTESSSGADRGDVCSNSLLCPRGSEAERGQFHMESSVGAEQGDACSNSLSRP